MSLTEFALMRCIDEFIAYVSAANQLSLRDLEKITDDQKIEQIITNRFTPSLSLILNLNV